MASPSSRFVYSSIIRARRAPCQPRRKILPGRQCLHPLAAAGAGDEFGSHRLELPNSPVFRDSPENVCRRCRLPVAATAGQCPVPPAAGRLSRQPVAAAGFYRRLSAAIGHRLKRPKSANPQDSLRIDGRAVPGSTCCRRMEYDPSRHRLKRLGSLVFRVDRADSRLLPRPGSARFHLLPRRPRESFGHRLEPQDSSFSENSREVPHKSCANPSTCFAGTSPFRGGQTVKKPRRAREGRSPFELSIVPSGVYGGHGTLFAPENPIFQRKKRFLAVFAPGNLLDFSKNW